MLEVLTMIALATIVIAVAAVLGPRLGVASPLILVAVGITASLIPVIPEVRADPEWILEGLLPPLLYAAAVSMPAINFRREFGTVRKLSVWLVIASALILGLFFQFFIPDLGFAWGVALGAIISPTDAVATSIIKKTNVPSRVVTILEGESLLNDATALVLLRTAVVSTAAAFSFWGAVGTFLYSVAVAIAIGVAVGWLNLAVRRRVKDSTVNTLLSCTVPFVASIPAEMLEASGLVAAVVAGLVTGFRAPRVLSPQHRASDYQVWATIQLVLEGAIFLLMGLQLQSILTEAQEQHAGIGTAVLLALGALAVTIVVRALYVTLVLLRLKHRTARATVRGERVAKMRDTLGDPDSRERLAKENQGDRRFTPANMDRFASRARLFLADLDYKSRQPLGAREGSILVWAGMRGAITVAAAQTLPTDTPQRSMLILIAFAVATVSLMVQGGTIKALTSRLYSRGPEGTDTPSEQDDQRREIMAYLRAASDEAHVPEGSSRIERRLLQIDAQRMALLKARDEGTFDAEALTQALGRLDAQQITMELMNETEEPQRDDRRGP